MDHSEMRGYLADDVKRARELAGLYGTRAGKVAEDRFRNAVAAGDLETARHWLGVRRWLRDAVEGGRFTRRLTDKLVWAMEQSLHQGRDELAREIATVCLTAGTPSEETTGERRGRHAHVSQADIERPPRQWVSGDGRYTRRVTDKLQWAAEQAVEQGREDIASLIGPVFDLARATEAKVAENRRVI